MKQITIIELLDEILWLLEISSAKHSGVHRKQIADLIKSQDIDVPFTLLNEALFKLEKDKFIRHEPGDVVVNFQKEQTKYYMLTIEGELAKQKNGYAGIIEREKFQKKIQNRKDWLLIVGSYLAGVGTILLFFVEVYKIYHLCK
jgi:hypothetical protein